MIEMVENTGRCATSEQKVAAKTLSNGESTLVEATGERLLNVGLPQSHTEYCIENFFEKLI